MKRRHFINGIAALAGTLLLAPIAAKAADTKPFDETQLFIRFFRIATGFEPNVNQLHWFRMFNQAERNQIYCNSFHGPRQTGMTTLMYVLALFQSKVYGKSVYITPSNNMIHYNAKARFAEMEMRLGKSTRDGKVHVGLHCTQNLGEKLYDFQFIMDDVPGFDKYANKYSENVYKFTTSERRFKYKTA